jgi:hypothetical protein
MPYDCQLLICSTDKELPWLNLCLRSVQRFWHGSISPIVVLTPECRKIIPCVIKELQSYVVFQSKEHHDIVRMTADSYLSAPLVLFLDVHEFFIRPCDISTFSVGNKPTVTVEQYSNTLCRHNVDNSCVQNRRWVIEEILGTLPEFEFTGRDPIMFHRHSIRRLREEIETKNRRPVADLMRNYIPDYFSSSNFLGEYCFNREKSYYDWVSVEKEYKPAIQPFWGIRDFTKGDDFEAVQKILA